MPNGSGLYNLGGGQVRSASPPRQVLPLGEAARRRQGMRGVLPGEKDWSKKDDSDRGKSGGFNILDLLKGIIGIPLSLFGGGLGREGDTSGDWESGPDFAQTGTINPEESGYSIGGQWHPTTPEAVRAHRMRRNAMQNAWTAPMPGASGGTPR